MADVSSLRQQLSRLVDQITQDIQVIESSMLLEYKIIINFKIIFFFSKKFKFETSIGNIN